MKYRLLTLSDTNAYANDAYQCYLDNRFVLDMQSPILLNSPQLVVEFVSGFIQAPDSYVLGIFDDNENYLFGLIIFDNIRISNSSCAQVHIVTNKSIWGKTIKNIYEEVLRTLPIDILYCEIPQIAVNAIAMCKRLGFKKTGYIPKALPYVNSKGEEKMYDINIFVREGRN